MEIVRIRKKAEKKEQTHKKQLLITILSKSIQNIKKHNSQLKKYFKVPNTQLQK